MNTLGKIVLSICILIIVCCGLTILYAMYERDAYLRAHPELIQQCVPVSGDASAVRDHILRRHILKLY